jgi:excisionase family DNA binding protein
MSTPEPARLLHSVADVCAATDLGRTTIFGLIASGELESVRVGTRRLIPATALEQFVANLRAS